MAAVIAGMMVAGSALSAVGAVSQANAAKAAASYNADIKLRDAAIAMNQAGADVDRVRREGERAKGSLIAGYGASGVTSDDGSPLDVLRMSAHENALDQNTVLYRGRLKAMGYQADAELSRSAGRAAQQQGYLNSASALLTGVSRAGASYIATDKPVLVGQY